MTRSYPVSRTDRTDITPGDGIWAELDSLAIDIFPWQAYAVYKPVTTARLLLCRDRLAVRMQTDEKPLLARAVTMNDDVFLDSCMEFFVQPDVDDPRYINFEFNPFGTLLLGIGPDRATRSRVSVSTAAAAGGSGLCIGRFRSIFSGNTVSWRSAGISGGISINAVTRRITRIMGAGIRSAFRHRIFTYLPFSATSFCPAIRSTHSLSLILAAV